MGVTDMLVMGLDVSSSLHKIALAPLSRLEWL